MLKSPPAEEVMCWMRMSACSSPTEVMCSVSTRRGPWALLLKSCARWAHARSRELTWSRVLDERMQGAVSSSVEVMCWMTACSTPWAHLLRSCAQWAHVGDAWAHLLRSCARWAHVEGAWAPSPLRTPGRSLERCTARTQAPTPAAGRQNNYYIKNQLL